MCGIAGFIGVSALERKTKPTLQRMVASIRHRGPDDEGVVSFEGGGMGMARLSIMDPVGGHQPISSEDGTVTVVCNGEIYNYPHLKRDLLRKGHTFKTNSDAEALVHLYEEEGLDFLKSIDGMFGFSLWDSKRKRLLVVRDRVGIKPLFYSRVDGGFVYGSEIKALLQTGRVPEEKDWNGLQAFLQYGYIPSPLTIYKDVKKLDPGHYILWENGTFQIKRYWSLSLKPTLRLSEKEAMDEFATLFQRTVKSHLMSDVPLGAFLSGGVDSSLVVAMMSELGHKPIKTFTMGFGGNKGGYLDERRYAQMVSRRYGTEHHEFEVEPRLVDIIDEIGTAFDEPFADDSVIPSYYICRETRRHVKVALTGLGGDELFAGYERYLGLHLSQFYDALPRVVRSGLIRPVVNHLPEQKNGHYTINHMKRFVRSAEMAPVDRYQSYLSVFSTAQQKGVLSSDAAAEVEKEQGGSSSLPFSTEQAPTLLDRVLYHDIHTYLPEDILALSDRLSMWHALELRVPFVDHHVLEFCARLPASMKIKRGQKKYLLKKVARQYLPNEIIDHRKQGFASPMASWLRHDLKDYVRDTLSPSAVAGQGLLNPSEVTRLIDEHQNRRELNDRKIFTLLMLQKWAEKTTRSEAVPA